MGDGASPSLYLALFLSVTFTPSCLYQRNTMATVCLIVGYMQPIESWSESLLSKKIIK